jgi:predicted TIM-barrel fold metal-dependent hydrolase
MRTARLFDGTILRFPDGTADEVIERVAREETAKRRGVGGIGAALKRGWWGGWAEPAETGAGAIGLAEDIIPGKQEGIESAEQRLRKEAARIRAKGGAGEADTFIEKLAEGLAAAPGTVASMAPFLLGAGAVATTAPVSVPAAALAAGTGALGFGAHGLARSGGEGLGRAAMGGLRGAAEGAAFGGVGHAVKPITSALGRRLAHGAGAAAIGGGASALTGEDTEDVLAHAATLGVLGLVSPGKRAKAKVDPRELLKQAKWKEAAPASELGARSARDLLMGKRGLQKDRFTEYEGLKPPGFPVNVELAHEARPVREQIIREVMENPERFAHDRKSREAIQQQARAMVESGEIDLKQLESALRGEGIPLEKADLYVAAAREFAGRADEKVTVARDAFNKLLVEGTDDQIIRSQRQIVAKLESDALEARAMAKGFQPAASRALGQHNYMVRSSSPAVKRRLNIIDENLYQKVKDAEAVGDWKLAKELMDAASKPKLRDKIYEIWINGLLSAPVTHMVNQSSNAAVQAFTLAERVGAVPIDIARAAITKTPRERFAAETYADISAFTSGIKKGFHEAIKAIKSEEYGMFEGKMEHTRMAVGGKAGQAVRLPGRFLKAGDMFWRALATEREIAVQSIRQAIKEGKKGAEAGKRAAEIRLDLPNYRKILEQAHKTGNSVLIDKARVLGGIRTAAEEAGHYQVFTQALGEKGNWAIKGRDMFLPAKVAAPFIRTPVNILKFGLERTPLGVFKMRGMKGGALSDQIIRTSLGSALMAGVWAAAQEGLVTGGGPADWTAQSNLRNTGWQPYSIKVGDEYISYQRLEPLSTIFGMMADLVELGKEPDEKLLDRAVAAFKDNLTNKTFLVGIEGLARAWANPSRESSQWFKQMLGSLVPAGVGKLQQALDPQIRQIEFRPLEKPETVVNPLLARIPGLSRQLPAKMGTMGQPIERAATAAERFASPVMRSTVKPERVVEQEFHRLRAHKSIPPMMPKRRKQLTIGSVYEKVELKDEEYDIFHTYHRRANEVLSRIVSSPGYQSMNEEAQAKLEEAQAKLLRRVYDKFRSSATKRVNAMIKARTLREKAGNR